ncbi:phage tail tape measure protein [Leuconostoc mesenteroides]|uniref:phage tail tape measure protein n=1 Tax=Leuconostoc mesenteroides TaxID=1245 RepID=UPI002361F318|nr:phage tail tape measure protein [Leuconostoc mesenteroides]
MESYSVQAVLSAVDRNFSQAFKDAADSTQTLQQRSGKALTAVGKSSALVGAAVGVMAGKAIKSYGDFQDSINQAAVIGGSSNKSLSGDMKGLEKVALSLGKTLPVSAKDAAQAMIEMARNGASVGELKKEFPAIAKAAAVSGEDMTATATTVQQAMNIWGGGAKNAAKDSATLAVVANRSNATIGDMGQVFANVGTTAKNMGFSLKDVGIAAGLMTNAGIPAAQASQDLNHALSQMVKPSKYAKATMQELGLSYTDAQGNMKPLKQIIQETAKATEGMSGAQKTAALNTLFGAAGAKAIAPLIDSVGKKAQKSGKGWDSFSSSIDKAAGSTAKANKYLTDNSQNMTKNVGQAIDQMLDAFDALIKTSIGSIAPQIKAVANAVGDFATWLTTSKSPMAGFVKGLIAWSPIIAGILLGFGALSLAAAKLIPIFTTLMTVFRVGKTLLVIATGSQAAASALTFMAQESKLAAMAQGALNIVMNANPFVLIVSAILAVVSALVLFFTQTKTGQAIWQGFMSFLSSAWTAMSSFLIEIWNTLGSVFSTIWQALVPVIQNLVSMLQSIWTGYVTAATAVWNGLVSIASGVWNLLKSVILGPILLLIDLLTGNWSQMKKDAVMIWNNIKSSLGQIVSGIVTAVSGYFKGLGQMLSGIWNSVRSAASSIWNAISSTIRNLANSAINGVKGAWSGITGWASGVWNGVKYAIRAAMNFSLFGAGSAIMNGFLDGLRSVWGAITSFVGGIASWIRRHKGPIQYDRKLLIPAGNAIMTGLNAGLVDNFKTVQKNVSGMAGSILDAATSVGNLATNAIGDPINALNNNIGGSYSSVMTLDHTSTTQPANITIGFDKHGYTAYVDDINNQQGKTALLKRNNSVQL